ncbi:unnamed protein product [Sphagnum jensenii]|uniref:Uncharacterized protein n=1 Tax=Sphagnum jensenii TaxID=128206 RepID=A0ABP0VAD5_9BRYO
MRRLYTITDTGNVVAKRPQKGAGDRHFGENGGYKTNAKGRGHVSAEAVSEHRSGDCESNSPLPRDR